MNNKRVFTSILTVLFTCIMLSPAMSEDAPPEPPADRLFLSSLTVLRYNPVGLMTQNRLMYSHRLVDSSSPLFRDTFIAAGPILRLNPACLRIGPMIEFQPVAVFNLRATYEFMRYFGLFENLQSYDRSDASFSDETRRENRGDAYPANGHHFCIEPTLQVKVWNIVARTKFSLEYFNMNLRGDDSYFYDQPLDTIVHNKAFLYTNDSDLLYMKGRLALGIRYSGVFTDDESSHMRIGPFVAWSFNTDDYTRFSRPTIISILGWYLDHPSRRGPLPYMVLGFAFSCDFMRSDAGPGTM